MLAYFSDGDPISHVVMLCSSFNGFPRITSKAPLQSKTLKRLSAPVPPTWTVPIHAPMDLISVALATLMIVLDSDRLSRQWPYFFHLDAIPHRSIINLSCCSDYRAFLPFQLYSLEEGFGFVVGIHWFSHLENAVFRGGVIHENWRFIYVVIKICVYSSNVPAQDRGI